MYDVIVVGARCAGAPTAMLMARAGYRVLLLEKAHFPKDKLSSHYLHQPGVALLDRWGVLEKLRAAGCTPIDRVSCETAGVRLVGSLLPADGHTTTYAPRRYVLDPILAAAAVEAGAEFREGCTVTGLLQEDGRVTGVKYRTAGGEFTERARLVVGADGMRSTVARHVQAPVIVEHAPMSCTYYSYWEGLNASHWELYERTGRSLGVVPTNDGRTLVMAYFPQAEFRQIRKDAQAAYLEAIRTTSPELSDRLSAARQAERLYGTGEQLNFVRQSAGPGWALVGDAAHHKDSIAARGITDAFRQVQMLTDYIGTDLHDPKALTAACDRYARDLEEKFVEAYHGTLSVAELKVTEEKLAVVRAISPHQELVDRYFGVLSGVCAAEEFYNEELERLVG
ncbi:NAD(P)/FAD-dependent oxidoreductase [Streptomyces sp. MST-110588]|uniref:NAD(P)/FAD-dependent oxidoreductase n=1 Tax=Streptomyces sp. MST-110588 TaxID=2833628 RepID=UPI001F5C5D83|nr:NAD(P)/FAD-dependent oxidoreductase [Streptomyces sp. MST-110588]UNO41036.1 FAD-dependent monooxygenase [Streptomyces sp. MST-110588]